MKRLALSIALLAAAAPALASSFAGSSAGASSAGSSGSSGSSSGDDKVLMAARDDAASFVATDGHLHGAQLEAALRSLRARDTAMQQASDMQLAKAILAL